MTGAVVIAAIIKHNLQKLLIWTTSSIEAAHQGTMTSGLARKLRPENVSATTTRGHGRFKD
jgi:hypothetical protein